MKGLLAAAAFLLTSACDEMMGRGPTPATDAGCTAYAGLRNQMPREVPLPTNAWGAWIVDTDDGMTGTCR